MGGRRDALRDEAAGSRRGRLLANGSERSAAGDGTSSRGCSQRARPTRCCRRRCCRCWRHQGGKHLARNQPRGGRQHRGVIKARVGSNTERTGPIHQRNPRCRGCSVNCNRVAVSRVASPQTQHWPPDGGSPASPLHISHAKPSEQRVAGCGVKVRHAPRMQSRALFYVWMSACVCVWGGGLGVVVQI